MPGATSVPEYGIQDIWCSNMEQEFKKIRHIVLKYPYVAMVRVLKYPYVAMVRVLKYPYVAMVRVLKYPYVAMVRVLKYPYVAMVRVLKYPYVAMVRVLKYVSLRRYGTCPQVCITTSLWYVFRVGMNLPQAKNTGNAKKENSILLLFAQGFIWSAPLRQCRAQLSKGTLFSATRALVPRCFLPSVP